jgi:hypothetical protein
MIVRLIHRQQEERERTDRQPGREREREGGYRRLSMNGSSSYKNSVGREKELESEWWA